MGCVICKRQRLWNRWQNSQRSGRIRKSRWTKNMNFKKVNLSAKCSEPEMTGYLHKRAHSHLLNPLRKFATGLHGEKKIGILNHSEKLTSCLRETCQNSRKSLARVILLTKAGFSCFSRDVLPSGAWRTEKQQAQVVIMCWPRVEIKHVQNVPGAWWWVSLWLGCGSPSKELKVWRIRKWHSRHLRQ